MKKTRGSDSKRLRVHRSLSGKARLERDESPGTPRLSGKVALITGGGSGIGRAISLALGRAGVRVMVNYRKRHAPVRSVVRVLQQEGGDAHSVQADVSTPQGARKAFQSTCRQFGRVDILINNVGDFLYKPVLDVKPNEWVHIVQNNLDSVFHCSKLAIPGMRRRKWGRIVNLGAAGCETIRAFPNTTAYYVSKTGVLILSKSLAREVARFGITVNVVAPGVVDTGVLPKGAMKALARSIPAKRAATPEEVADVVLFLLSDEAAHITGTCITMSGGWLL